MIDYASFIANISFRFIQPTTRLPRGYNRLARLLERLNLSLEIMNTRLPQAETEMRRRLQSLCKIPKMSTFAIGAMINQAVAQMPAEQAFVNIGVWNGFTFLSGLVGHPHQRCIGVDNFSEFGGPKQAFFKRLEQYQSKSQQFYDMDYQDYFATLHSNPIGFYIYDGDHSYEHQLDGLRVAEPFFADRCLILVDDTNTEAPRRATLDFISSSAGAYDILFDSTTHSNCHPTFWDGVIILRKGA